MSNQISEKRFIFKTFDNLYLSLSKKDYERVKEKCSVIIKKETINEEENKIIEIIFTKKQFEVLILYKFKSLEKKNYLKWIIGYNFSETSLVVIEALKNMADLTNEETNKLIITLIFEEEELLKKIRSMEVFMEFYKKKGGYSELKWYSSVFSNDNWRYKMAVPPILYNFKLSFHGPCTINCDTISEINVLEKFIILSSKEFVGVIENNLNSWLEFYKNEKLFLKINGCSFSSNNNKTIYIFNYHNGSIISYDENFNQLKIINIKNENISSLIYFKKGNRLIIFSGNSTNEYNLEIKEITYFNFDFNEPSSINYKLDSSFVIKKDSYFEEIDFELNKIRFNGLKTTLSLTPKPKLSVKENGEFEKDREEEILYIYEKQDLIKKVKNLKSIVIGDKTKNHLREKSEIKKYIFPKSNYGMYRKGKYFYFIYNFEFGNKMNNLLKNDEKISLYDAIELIYYKTISKYLTIEENVEKTKKILNKYE